MNTRRSHWWLLVLLSLLLVSGCSITLQHLHMTMSFRPDGSNSFRVDMAWKPDMTTGLVMAGAQSCQDLIKGAEGPLKNAQVENRWSENRCIFAWNFRRLEEARSYLQALGFTVDRLNLDSEKKRFEIQLAWNTPGASMTTENLELVLELPGRPLQHNAHEVRGRQLIWRWGTSARRTMPNRVELQAVSEVGGTEIPPVLVLLIPGVIALMGVAWILIRRGGLPISPMAPEGPRFCPGCGAPLVPGARFCSRCGRSIRG